MMLGSFPTDRHPVRSRLRAREFDAREEAVVGNLGGCALARPAPPSVPYIIHPSPVFAAMAQPAPTGEMMTVAEFLARDWPECQVELVRGEARVNPPPGGAHGVVCGNLLAVLIPHVLERRLGRIFADGVGFELVRLPQTVRVPDVSFVRARRLPAGGFGPGLLKVAPDLAVEVLSPSETATSLEEKLGDYRGAGTALIWVIDPERRTVMVVSDDAPARWLTVGETLDGANVLPEFRCAVVALFDGLASSSARMAR